MNKKEKTVLLEIIERLARIEENVKWIKERTEIINHELSELSGRVNKLENKETKRIVYLSIVKFILITLTSSGMALLVHYLFSLL